MNIVSNYMRFYEEPLDLLEGVWPTNTTTPPQAVWAYRRLISKSAFMQFLAIFTFLHIWKDVGRGYLKMQGP